MKSRTRRRSDFREFQLAPHLARSMEEAGASAYAWHDDETAKWVDPLGRWRRAADLVHMVFAVAAVFTVCVSVFFQFDYFPAFAALLMVAYFATYGRFRTVHPVTSLLVIAAMQQGYTWPSVLLLVGSLVAALVLLPKTHRPDLFALGAVFAGLSFHLPFPVDDRALVGAVATAASTVLFLMVLGSRGLPRPWTRVRAADFRKSLPAHRSRLPGLLRIAKRGQLKQVPLHIKKKKVGADGERRTGLLMLGLPRFKGTRVAHDVLIPGAEQANCDHVLLARAGLVVLDTKQFGTKAEPGYVTLDSQTGEVVHVTGHGTSSLDKSVRTLVWAAREIGGLVGTPATGVIVVHNAAVSPGVSTVRDGVKVDVISAWALTPYVNSRMGRLGWREFAGARAGLVRLRGAVTGTSPQVVAPLGSTRDAVNLCRSFAAGKQGPSVPFGSSPGPLPPVSPGQPEHGSLPLRPSPAQDTAPSVSPDEQAPAQAVPQQSVPPAQGLPAYDPAEVISERIAAKWDDMELSEPAAADDSEMWLREVTRGTFFNLVEFTETESGIHEQKKVAMTGACHGAHGDYVWYCSPEQWAIYQNTGRKVDIATISVHKVNPDPGPVAEAL